VIALVFYTLVCSAQIDSILLRYREQMHRDSAKIYTPKKVSFDFQFDNRHSFVQNRAITIQGFNPAILVNQKYRWGIGLYRVIEPYQVFRSTKKTSVSASSVATNRELNMYFATPNFRYIFFRRNWMEASAELAVGFGTIDYTIRNENNTKVLSSKTGLFVPAGIGCELVLIPVRWLGVGGSLGYRKSLKTYDIDGDFDGLYFSYGVKLFLGAIYKDLKYKSVKKKYVRESGKISLIRGN
jgi:hypothetical protein